MIASCARRDLAWAAALTALAFLHRLLFLRAGYDTGWAFSLFYEGDAQPFFHYARAILAGNPYDGGVPFHPPGFPHLLAVVHALCGAGEVGARVPSTAVRVVLAGIGSTSAGLLYLLVRPYLGRSVAAVAGLLWVWSFAGYVLATTPVSESFYQVLLLATLVLWTRKTDHALAAPSAGAHTATGWRRLAWPAAVGGLLAGLALVRAEGLLVALLVVSVGLLGAARLAPGVRRRALVPWLVAAGACIVGLLPWTIRNHLQLSRINYVMEGRIPGELPTLVPLTAYGPLNLVLANHAGADGTFSRALLPDPSGEGKLDLTRPDHLDVFLHGDEMAWRWIRENPGDFLALVGRKWQLSLSALALGWLQWDLPGGLSGIRRPVDMFVPDDPTGAYVLLVAIACGLLLALRAGTGGRRFLGVVAIVVAVPLAATGLFYGYARLVAVALPLLYAIAGIPLAALGTAVGRRLPAWLPPVRAAALVAGVVLVVELVGAWGGERSFEVSGTVLEGRGVLNPHEDVRIRPLD